jgi:Flp pilus assembly protein TadD
MNRGFLAAADSRGEMRTPVLKAKLKCTIRCALAASLVVLRANAAQPTDDLLKDALARYQKGDMEGAIKDYEAFLELHPEVFQIRSNLGAALARLGRFDRAVVEYSAALSAEPDNPGVIMNLGLAHYKMGHLNDAVKQWSKAHTLDPANWQITLLLADAESRLGDSAEVIALLGPVDHIDARDLGVAYLLGTALLAAHRSLQAQALVERILENGDSAQVRILVGTMELQRGDSDAAVKDLERATEMDPMLPSVFSSYGSALLSMGEPIRAEAAFRRELVGNPNDFLTHLDLGFLLKQNQQLDDAMTHLRRALELRPGDIGARYQIASVLLLAGDLDAAVAELESILHDSPHFVAAVASLTTAYYRLKRKQDGDRERALVQKLNAEAPSDVQAGSEHVLRP